MENLPTVHQKARTLRDYMNGEAIKEQLRVALPQWLSIDRFLRVVFGALLRNPKLIDCTKESLLQSVMACAQLGLEPILGRAHLIPYKNSKQIAGKWQKVLECQFQVGYQGFVDLARRSGELKDIRARVVYANDDFDLDYGNNTLRHKPHLFDNPGEPIGAYTKWVLKDGWQGQEFMPLHEIYRRRQMSQAYRYAVENPGNKNAQKCPWIEWPGEMMQKTALKNHIKILPMSIEFMQAVEVDNRADLDPSRALTDGAGYGSPALTLPESTGPDFKPVDFDLVFNDITGDKHFKAFWELAREGNTVEGKPPTDDQLKLLALNDNRGPGAFRDAFLEFKAKQKPAKKTSKKTTKAKGAASKSQPAANQRGKSGNKSQSSLDSDQNDPNVEYLALQQSDDWQEMTRIFESNPKLYRKYKGKLVKTFDEAKEFVDLVQADPDYKDNMPGA